MSRGPVYDPIEYHGPTSKRLSNDEADRVRAKVKALQDKTLLRPELQEVFELCDGVLERQGRMDAQPRVTASCRPAELLTGLAIVAALLALVLVGCNAGPQPGDYVYRDGSLGACYKVMEIKRCRYFLGYEVPPHVDDGDECVALWPERFNSDLARFTYSLERLGDNSEAVVKPLSWVEHWERFDCR